MRESDHGRRSTRIYPSAKIPSCLSRPRDAASTRNGPRGFTVDFASVREPRASGGAGRRTHLTPAHQERRDRFVSDLK
jgi:hypothetical protein